MAAVVQVWRWSQQYQAQLAGKALPEMTQLIDWLQRHIPPDDSDPTTVRISHGDYRCSSLAHLASPTLLRSFAACSWVLKQGLCPSHL